MRLTRASAIVALWMTASCLLPVLRGAQAGGAPQASQAQEARPRVRRLILKDGSFEPIIQFELKGDRVRYLSADRHEWEEMPNSLVDWPATEKYARDAVEARAAVSAQAVREDLGPPLAAPGIRLPPEGGVFLLDSFQGTPELIGLSQSGADVNKNTARNILRAAVNPIAGPKQTIELKGAHAAVQAHVTSPSIYISLETDNDPAAGSHSESPGEAYRIVKCEEKNGNRIVGVIEIAIYGKVKQEANVLDVKVESLSGSWVKITPAAALRPGEYALVEMLGKQGMNQFVWDFGINPAAPENPGAAKPEPARQPPVLLKKTKKPG